MNYRNLVDKIKTVILQEDFVNTFECGDVYTINNKVNTEYSLLCFELQNVRLNKKTKVNEYVFRVYYIDLLTESLDNINDINAATIYTFNSMLNRFENEEDIDMDITSDIMFFTQSFRDKCAGGYATITVKEYSPYNYCE